MERFCPIEKCSGCGACMNACPRKAISMQEEQDGFLYPFFDLEKCVDCNACVNACPAQKELQGNVPNDVFLAWCNNEKLREKSSSGGIFAQIAAKILEKGGIVFGAAYNEKMRVAHKYIESVEELPLLQSSKYVQSEIGNAYKEAQEFLKKGRLVYFVGTPCQIAGLNSFLKKNYDNLLTSDLICHGAPSNALLNKQIDDIQQKYKNRIIDFNFRSKARFGQGYDIEVSFENGGKKFFNAELVPYFYGFWRNISLRESCYHCHYSSERRVSDITLGDYWLAKKIHRVKTSKGTSLILVNTLKGKKMLDECKSSVALIPDNLDRVKKIQAHLSRPVKVNSLHASFVKDFGGKDWDYLCQRYFRAPLRYRCKMRLRNILKTLTLYKLWK